MLGGQAVSYAALLRAVMGQYAFLIAPIDFASFSYGEVA